MNILSKTTTYFLGLAALLLFSMGAVIAAEDQGANSIATLGSVDELKAQFNREKTSPRLLLILSPT